MSKKKRSRGPAPHVRPVASATVVHEAATSELAVDTETPASSDPAVDVALAQAAALAHDAPSDEAPTAPAPVPAQSPKRRAAAPAAGATDDSADIRGVLIQVAGGRLLLPNATIAEVLSYAEPERDATDVPWLLGRFRWRGWQIPLVAFSRLSGIGDDNPGLGTKVIVLKALGGDRRIPFFAIVTQGFPRLVTVSRAALGIESDDGPLPPGVQAYVRLNDDVALLPDLAQIEQRLHEMREAA